jgi:hypothetical protein
MHISLTIIRPKNVSMENDMTNSLHNTILHYYYNTGTTLPFNDKEQMCCSSSLKLITYDALFYTAMGAHSVLM